MKESGVFPEHIGFILDGNGRWAKERGYERIEGHREGYKRLEQIYEYLLELNIRYVTFFVFSTENRLRPLKEVNALMDMGGKFVETQTQKLNNHNVKVLISGTPEGIDDTAWSAAKNLEDLTKDNTNSYLQFAFNYGSWQEVTSMTRRIAKLVKSGDIDIGDITQDYIKQNLWTAQFPNLDLVIRTGGEKRLSNFMLLQSAYAELYFTDTLWPEFSKTDLDDALEDYMKRQRRFGVIVD